MANIKEKVVVIYVKRITVKEKRIYAYNYGLKAFRLEIPEEKFRTKES